jgi:hypothetical protein
MTAAEALTALRKALVSGRVRLAESIHIRESMDDEGIDFAGVIRELTVAVAHRDVHAARAHAGRFVAFGVRLVVVFEVLDGVVVVTVFDAA